MKLLSSLLDALLPEECVVCGKPLVDGEKYICLHCMLEMPRVDIKDVNDNEVHDTLASTRPLERCASLFRYRRGSPYTRLIQAAKYEGRPDLARWLGRQLAAKLLPLDFFNGIDALVPVPLNRWKMLKRGYNQSLLLAQGIRDVSGVPVLDVLSARRHSTQTKKGAMGRRVNATGIFSVKKPLKLDGCNHVAVVDDVITTGSTMLECVEVLHRYRPAMRVSVLSGALTTL